MIECLSDCCTEKRHFNQHSTRSSSLSWRGQDSSLSTVTAAAAQTVRPMKEMVRMKAPARCDYLYLVHLLFLTHIYEYKEGAVRIIRMINALCLWFTKIQSEKKMTYLFVFTAQTSRLFLGNSPLLASGCPQSLCRLTT